MTEPLRLQGIELRYALTSYLTVHGVCSVQELVAGLTRFGFGFHGRPSKAVSDALRWERRLGRVYKRGRAFYGPGQIPRATAHRIDRRVMELREQADLRRREGALINPLWLRD
jgi:hypothetical protein